MELLIATNTCSAKKYIEIQKKRIKDVIDPQQKFFRLFIEGLNEQDGVHTTVLSALPVSASSIEQKNFAYEEEKMNNVEYHYIPFKNGKFTRYLTLIISSYKDAKKWCLMNKNSNAAILVDPLVPVIAIPTRIIAQKKNIKVGAVVTDIPSLTTAMKARKESSIKERFLAWYQGVADKDILKYDFYIPLTESLNDAVNTEGKPCCIIEGFADGADTEIETEHSNYIMYAGGVYEKFGLKALVEGFIALNRSDVELWIFGEGPYAQNIIKLNKKYPNVKYKGCVSAEEIVALEKKALLLVNPRPTNEEFAKYSFPSKTMEYLLSGTPVVSTRLPGIPDEYFNYLFSFPGDSTEEITWGLNNVLSLDKEELSVRGKAGHDFVLNQKNNVVMAKKIVTFIVNRVPQK